MDLQELLDEIIAFRDERDWEQFHSPNQLAAALSIEAAELQEVFLWKSREEVDEAVKKATLRNRMKKEIADVLIYALLFCDSIGESPTKMIQEKLENNAKKYPVHKSKGRADKYTELPSDKSNQGQGK